MKTTFKKILKTLDTYNYECALPTLRSDILSTKRFNDRMRQPFDIARTHDQLADIHEQYLSYIQALPVVRPDEPDVESEVDEAWEETLESLRLEEETDRDDAARLLEESD